MSATAEQKARLRRMVNEPTEAVYSDTVLAAYIERYALVDELGEAPYVWDESTEPPTRSVNDDWTATYDLNAAAADIWDEKAAAAADAFDFRADGAEFSRSQVVGQYMARARYYRSRRASQTMTLVKWPKETRGEEFGWIGNLGEVD